MLRGSGVEKQARRLRRALRLGRSGLAADQEGSPRIAGLGTLENPQLPVEGHRELGV